jgi:hypothetical protein
VRHTSRGYSHSFETVERTLQVASEEHDFGKPQGNRRLWGRCGMDIYTRE